MVTHHSQPKIKGKERHITQRCRQIKKAARLKAKGSVYEFVSSTRNPDYEGGLKPISFESCLIHNKARRFFVKTRPKYITQLAEFGTDEEGLPVLNGFVETNDIKASNHRKIKAVDKWCTYWQPKYKAKEVTLFFITLTRMNKARMNMKNLLNVLRTNLSRNNIKLLDYLWILEVSENLHAHYHLVIATERLSLKKIPSFLKLEHYWGQRTEIDFVKKNIRHYLSKYFTKEKAVARIEGGVKHYGIMRKPTRI